MRLRSFWRFPNTRRIIVYLLLVASAAVALLYLEVQGAARQRDLLATLHRSNALLAGARVAQELETAIHTRATTCFHSRELLSLIAYAALNPPGTAARHSRPGICDIAEDLFIWKDGVLWPLSSTNERGRNVAARLLGVNFPPRTPLYPGVTYAIAVAGAPPVQVMYAAPPPTVRHGLVAVLSLNMDAVRIELGAARHRMGVPVSVKLHTREALPAGELFVNFSGVLPYWVLAVYPASAAPGHTSEFLLPLSGAIIVLLIASVALAIRDGIRQGQMADARAALISGVSHDLKTPITAIRLYAEMLLDDSELPSAQRHQFYRVIFHESGRLARLVGRVLGYARMQFRNFEYRMHRGDLAETLRQTVTAYEPFARHFGFTHSCPN